MLTKYFWQVATFIPYVMMLKAEFKARFNSVERVCQYANVSFTLVCKELFSESIFRHLTIHFNGKVF